MSTTVKANQHQSASESLGTMGLPIQTKLTIGEPGDKYEQEADRVAAQVVSQINAPAPQQSGQSQPVQREAIPEEEDDLQTKPLISTIQREEVPEEEEELQMKPAVQLLKDNLVKGKETYDKQSEEKLEYLDGEERKLTVKWSSEALFAKMQKAALDMALPKLVEMNVKIPNK